MDRPLVLLWGSVSVAATVGLGIAGTHAATAHTSARHARLQLATVAQQTQELARLRHDAREYPVRPDGGLASKVSSAMARAGLPASALQGLSPESQAGLTGASGERLTRQRATLTLSGPSLPQVGTFLDAWRTAEPDWVISSIDLSPIHGSRQPAELGSDLQLRCIITIEGIFKESPRERMNGVPR